MAKVPVATTASGNPLLSTLVAAVTVAGLGDSLNSAQNITVFAPTNEAFAKILKSDLDAVLADRATLSNILTYHVVPQRLSPDKLAGTPGADAHSGLYGYAGACKWITQIELATFDSFDAYWVKRGWAARAPVKTASRIDRPSAFARLQEGEVMIAGVAWAQRRGISAVEVKVDEGAWEKAVLMPVPSTDTWVQWRLAWQARSGGHTLRVRATDGRGEVQTEQRATPFPDGATGWHTVAVSVA